jgi:hypothetical protein
MRGSVSGDNSRAGQRRNLYNRVCTVLASSSGDGTRRECVVGPEGGLTCGRDACGPAWGRPVLVLVPSAWVIPLLSPRPREALDRYTHTHTLMHAHTRTHTHTGEALDRHTHTQTHTCTHTHKRTHAHRERHSSGGQPPSTLPCPTDLLG